MISKLNWFLSSSIISYLGSSIFLMGFITKYSEAPNGLVIIGTGLAVARAGNLVSSLFLTSWVDRNNKSDVLILVLLAATLFDFSILWINGTSGQTSLFFIIFLFFRYLFSGLEHPTRLAFLKASFVQPETKERSAVLWLSKGNQGMSVFTGLMFATGFSSLQFDVFIWLDIASFVLSAIVIWNLQKPSFDFKAVPFKGPLKGIAKYYNSEPLFAFKDLAVVLTLCGFQILITRLGNGQKNLVSIYYAANGASVWLGGFLLRNQMLQKIARFKAGIILFTIIALNLLLLRLTLGHHATSISLCLALASCFWIMLHEQGVILQLKTPKGRLAQASGIRGVQISLTFIAGDILYGYYSKVITLESELLFRSLLAISLGTLVVLITPRFKSETTE